MDAVARAVAGQARRDGLTDRSRTAGRCDPGLALIPEHAPASRTVHAIYRSSTRARQQQQSVGRMALFGFVRRVILTANYGVK